MNGASQGTHTLRAARAVGRTFDADSRLAEDPELRTYVSDMVRPYGLAPREDLLASGSGHTYGEMAEQLIGAAVAPHEPVDVLVLAFAVPDARPGRTLAPYLSGLCPGRPVAFGLCDQGTAAAFTAVRIIDAFRPSYPDGFRALLVVAEQSALHHEPAARPAPMPARHAAVAVLFEPCAAGGRIRQFTGVAPHAAAGLLDEQVAELAPRGGELPLLLGPGISTLREPSGTGAGPDVGADQPYTGLWSRLAGLTARELAAGRAILADYDPVLGCLSLCTLECAP
ncbi:MAG TPA: hypothetical protein VGM10_20020 [Actinocrinis sp.]|jgi:4-hydroxymandelate oxidase